MVGQRRHIIFWENASDSGSRTYQLKVRVGIPGSGRSPGEGNGYLLQCFLPGEFHGQRRLVGYSPGVTKSWT